MAINWALLNNNSFENALARGMEMGKIAGEARDKRQYQNALNTVMMPQESTVPDSPANAPDFKKRRAEAMRVIAARNPGFAMKLMERADEQEFNTAMGEYLTPNGQPNALLGLPSHHSGINPAANAQWGSNPQPDTLRTNEGPNLRLYGADSPESEQVGWDRAGNPVRIGDMATIALGDVVTPNALVGPVMMQSWGRPVAPVMQDGADVGQHIIRQGNALAVPEYLADDAERRASYMEAERLARQNRLGVHDTFAQTPEQHRANPDFAPDRETVARFWDTPTPFAGLRPEVEAGYVDLLKSGSADDILAYATANRFTLDPEDVRGYVADRDAGKSVSTVPTYKDTPAPLTDVGDGRTGATMRGVADGVLAGGLDEAGAVIDTFGLTPGRENVWNSEQRLADIWANNQQQNSAIIGYDDMANPGWRLGGQIAGGLVVPFGAKAKTVPELFRVGAAYGGAEGFLGAYGSFGERAIGGAIGVPVGGAVGAVGGKALDFIVPKVAARFGPKRAQAAQETGEAAEGYADETAVSATQDVPAPPEGFKLDRATRMDAPVTEAQLRAASEDIAPGDVLPVASNVVADADEAVSIDAGRYQQAVPVNERNELKRQTIVNYMGREVPKVGPVDMVGYLRTRGGLADQGGELTHMGLTNKARTGMDHVGQEMRFGPLLNEQGMTLDDAAHAAWEAGYFPELSERPTVSQFLDGLRDTYEGRNRRFLPEDQGQVQRFEAARADRYDLEQRIAEEGPIWRDTSVPADEPQFAPVEAFEDWGPTAPDFAGTINLAKLGSPQDITRALSQTEKRMCAGGPRVTNNSARAARTSSLRNRRATGKACHRPATRPTSMPPHPYS